MFQSLRNYFIDIQKKDYYPNISKNVITKQKFGNLSYKLYFSHVIDENERININLYFYETNSLRIKNV